VVKTFGVCDFSRFALTDWRLRRLRLWFLALMTAIPQSRQVSRVLVLAASNIQLRLRQQYSIETPPAVFIESLSILIKISIEFHSDLSNLNQVSA